jgi:hypothetical protein
MFNKGLKYSETKAAGWSRNSTSYTKEEVFTY